MPRCLGTETEVAFIRRRSIKKVLPGKSYCVYGSIYGAMKCRHCLMPFEESADKDSQGTITKCRPRPIESQLNSTLASSQRILPQLTNTQTFPSTTYPSKPIKVFAASPFISSRIIKPGFRVLTNNPPPPHPRVPAQCGRLPPPDPHPPIPYHFTRKHVGRKEQGAEDHR